MQPTLSHLYPIWLSMCILMQITMREQHHDGPSLQPLLSNISNSLYNVRLPSRLSLNASLAMLHTSYPAAGIHYTYTQHLMAVKS